MFIVRAQDKLWPARRVALKDRSGGLVRRFNNPEQLVEFLRYRPRTNYILDITPAENPLPANYQPAADDITAGQIWFDPDQNKIVTNG